ncbi:PIN domain-containing protein [Treponema sp. UBA753]|uniref:PIN domain-containing protein n=1 Tax=Treponema sp. UBA753 TaxID=1947747 RepID=UPI0025D2EB8D|nr:PIN domain-containing protein [Treponema sp. UBA753]
MKNIRVLIDTNIFLDFFCKRASFCDSAQKIISLCKDGILHGFVAAHSISNMFYILRKDFTDDERRELLLDLCSIFTVCAVDKGKIIHALKNKSFSDFEDGLQNECALSENLDCIITRNKKDFLNSSLPVYTADEFLESL